MARFGACLLGVFFCVVLSIIHSSGQKRLRLATPRELEIARIIDSVYLPERPSAPREGPAGLFYRKVKDLPEDIRKDLREHPVDFIDTEESLENPRPRRFDLEIDGVAVKEYRLRIIYRVVPVFHEALLKEGLHQIRIVHPSLKRVVYDGQILVNGIDEVSVRLGRCAAPGDPCPVTVKKGTKVVFRGTSRP